MIRSMTAYARHELKEENWEAVWELRSVNHRYLETYIRLPEQFKSMESLTREHLRGRLTRGKIECQLRFDIDASSTDELNFNKKLAIQVIKAAESLKQEYVMSDINPVDILRWQGVMSAKEQDLDSISTKLLSALEKAIDQFIEVREREGIELKKLIEQRLQGVTEQVEKIKQHMPEIIQWQRSRLIAKFEEINLQIDKERLEQEMVFTAQRLDVSEELDRLSAHVKETYYILKKPEAVGRRLDFMMQEFNREANTLASKSINNTITTAAVELKVLIEQMREQIQNIE